MRTLRPIPSSIGPGFVYRFSWMTKSFLSFFHFQILTSPASVTASRESYLLVSVISWVRLQSGNSQKSVSALQTLQFQICTVLFRKIFRFALLAALSCFENQEQKCGSAIHFQCRQQMALRQSDMVDNFECSQRVNVLMDQLLGKHLNDYMLWTGTKCNQKKIKASQQAIWKIIVKMFHCTTFT